MMKFLGRLAMASASFTQHYACSTSSFFGKTPADGLIRRVRQNHGWQNHRARSIWGWMILPPMFLATLSWFVASCPFLFPCPPFPCQLPLTLNATRFAMGNPEDPAIQCGVWGVPRRPGAWRRVGVAGRGGGGWTPLPAPGAGQALAEVGAEHVPHVADDLDRQLVAALANRPWNLRRVRRMQDNSRRAAIEPDISHRSWPRLPVPGGAC